MKTYMKLAALLFVPILSVGCGQMSVGKNIQLKLDTERQTAAVEVEMGNGLEVAINGDFPVAGGKGRIYFVPATQTANARIGFEANLVAIAGGNLGLGTISTLPSGTPLPVAIRPPLLVIPVTQSADFNVKAAFSVTPEFQLAAVVGISKMNSTYVPAAMAICQDFRNAENFAFAAVCIYGPNGSNPGGVFIGGNFGDVLHNIIDNGGGNSSMALRASSEAYPVDMKVIAESSSVSSEVFSDSMYNVDSLSASKKNKALKNIWSILRKK